MRLVLILHEIAARLMSMSDFRRDFLITVIGFFGVFFWFIAAYGLTRLLQ